MKVGIFMEGYVRKGETPQNRLRELVHQARAADGAGLSTFAISEQHFKHPTNSTSAPDTVLSAAAVMTERIRLMAGVVVLPFHHPLATAERWATVDVLSGGRLDFGIGRGNTPLTADVFGVPIPETEARAVEALDVIQRAWSDAPFSFDGRFHTFPELSVTPRPVQQPAPPIYWAATSPASHERGGALGHHLLTSSNALDLSQVERRISRYRAGVAQWQSALPAGQGGDRRVVCMALGHCAATPEQARQQAEPFIVEYINRTVEMYKVMVQRSGRTDVDFSASEKFVDNFDALFDTGGVVLGSPDEMIEGLKRFEVMGVDEVLIRMDGPSHEEALESIALIGSEVVPAVAG